VTECYQPLEASYKLTRRCLKVCYYFHVPVGIITKGNLVRRDIDLIALHSERARMRVYLSIPFLDAVIVTRSNRSRLRRWPASKRCGCCRTLASRLASRSRR
jgi:DNA repair photolyase